MSANFNIIGTSDYRKNFWNAMRQEPYNCRVCQEFCVNHFSVCRVIVFHEFRHTLIHQQLVANERPVWYPAP